MTYKVQTPELKRVTEGLMGVFDEATNKTANVEQGTLAVAAGGKVQKAIETDLKVRLAAPTLKEIEN